MPILSKECSNCGKRILPFLGQFKVVEGCVFCAECYREALKKAKMKKGKEVWQKIANGD